MGLLAVALAAGRVASASSPGPAAPRSGGAVPHAVAAPKSGERNLTLLYGDDHCFGIVPPAGWVIDDSSGLGAKIRVVLYRKGEKWATAGTVMYANPIHFDANRPKTLEQVIEGDVASFRRSAPKGTITNGAPITTSKGKTAEVRIFTGPGGTPKEAVAYVMEKGLVMLLVLSSREIGGFDAANPAFREMVASYQLVAAGIQTPTH